MGLAGTPAELAAALDTVPRQALLRGARLWERAAGTTIGHTRKAGVIERISRWAFDPAILGRLVDSLPPEVRTVLALANVLRGRSFLEMLCAGAALGCGDLLEPASRCAALGLVVPVNRLRRPEALWSGDRLLHPSPAEELVVPEPAAGVEAATPIRQLEVEAARAVEPALRIPPEETLAAALTVAAGLIAEPLPLTRSGTVSVRAARAAARTSRPRGELPLGFCLALLGSLGVMRLGTVGEARRLVVDPAALDHLWREPGAVEEAVYVVTRADLVAWALETGDTEPASPHGYLTPAALASRTWRDAGLHCFLVYLLLAIPKGAGWLRVDRLAAEAARRAPAWLIGARDYWGWEPDRYTVRPEDRHRLEAYAVLYFARTCVRCGVLELGSRDGTPGPKLASLPAPDATVYGEPWAGVLGAARALSVRPTGAASPEPAGDQRDGRPPRLTGDLELHVAQHGLPRRDRVVAALAGESLPVAPGDPVRRFRLTAASVARAVSAGVPREAVEGLLERCRPAPPDAARRRLREWLDRSGSAVLRRGWLLARWARRADRDAAVAALPGSRPVGTVWALVPPTITIHGTVVQLPAALLGLDDRGRLTASDRPLLELALARVAKVDRHGAVRPSRERIEAAGLGHGEAVAALAAWAGGAGAVTEAVGAEVGRALGMLGRAGVLDATLVLPPGAAAANRLRAALTATGATVVPLSPLALLVVGGPGRERLAALAREAGLELEPAGAEQLLAALPASLDPGARLDDFEELSVRSGRARLEQAMAADRPIRLLLPGRRGPRPVTARVHSVHRLDGLVRVWLEILEGRGRGRDEVHAVRDIVGFGALA